jgi:RimJ/RimL family protein N-acetyltransferase
VSLQKENIKIVSTTEDDPEIAALAQDYEILKNLTETRSYPQPMPSTFMFRVELEGKLIGEVSLKSIRWFNRKAQVSIVIAPEHQGKGYGEQALKAIMEYAFLRMNLYRLEAEVIEYNRRAQKLFEKLGFTFEGKLRQAKYFEGKYYDILRYGMLRTEYDAIYKTG